MRTPRPLDRYFRRIFLGFLLGLVTVYPADAVNVEPKQITIVLDRGNNVVKHSLGIVPDRGVRLIFPFIFDELTKHYPGTTPLFTSVSNEDVFSVTEPEDVEGQNILIIGVNIDALHPDNTYIGEVQISGAGFFITLSLKTTDQVDEHYTDVLFELSDETRDYLIDEVIEREKKQLRAEHELVMQNLNEKILAEAVILFAAAHEEAQDFVASYAIKQRTKIQHETGEELTVTIRDIKRYKADITVISFFIRNNSNRNIILKNIVPTFTQSGNDIEGAWGCTNELLSPGKMLSCPFATQNSVLWDERRQPLSFRLETDAGGLFFEL